MLDLFDKLILPILNYGSELTGLSNFNRIEQIHLKFCKQLLGVRTQTQNNFIYGELGRTPLKQYRIVSVIRYWLKLNHCSDLKYAKRVYMLMLNDMENNPQAKSWAKNVKCMLESMGFYDVWIFGVGNADVFIQVFRQRLKDTFLQAWNEEINISTRADSYKLFSDFGFKEYLNILKIKKFRQEFTRLRLSSHKLNIEVGRWHKPNPIPRNERLCTFCNRLEDEFHFLFECKLYTVLRKKYLKPVYWRHPNILKFTNLMSTKNNEELKNLSVFIYNSFHKRNEYLQSAL
jgi:hypothetical protein